MRPAPNSDPSLSYSLVLSVKYRDVRLDLLNLCPILYTILYQGNELVCGLTGYWILAI